MYILFRTRQERPWIEFFYLFNLNFKTLITKKKEYFFVRTEQQVDKIINDIKNGKNPIILYTIVETKLAKYLSKNCEENLIPCFGVLGNLILAFSKLLNEKAIHKPSAQHVLDADYYKRIEAIQFTMAHDDGKKTEDILNSDVILLGVSRTSKTPTSIYLANKGMKISNIPLINEQSVPDILKEQPNCTCIIGLIAEPDRLVDLRKNRMQSIKENENKNYINYDKIKNEIVGSKKLFQKYNWPTIDVTRKSVEETAASILKIHEIFNEND